MTCKDCIYCENCPYIEVGAYYEYLAEKDCYDFKDKSLFY